MYFQQVEILEGELFNGFQTLTIGDVTLTAETVQRIIHERFDRFPVEEIHFSDVAFESDFVFYTFVMALRELSSLERLTWHSALTLSQWHSLLVEFDSGQISELDAEWKVIDVDESSSTEDESNNENSLMSASFANMYRVTSEKLVLRFDSDTVIQTIFHGFTTGRAGKINEELLPELPISVHSKSADPSTFSLWATEMCRHPAMISSFKAEGIKICQQAVSSLIDLLDRGNLVNLALSDSNDKETLPTLLLEKMTASLSRNNTLERLALCSIQHVAHPLWSAMFHALGENKSIKNLQLMTAEPVDAITLMRPFATELPRIHNLRILETRWYTGMTQILLPGLRANCALHDIVLDGIGGEDPTDADVLRDCLDRNRLYNEMKHVKLGDDDLCETLAFLADLDMGKSGTALFHIVRQILLPYLVIPKIASRRGSKRKVIS